VTDDAYSHLAEAAREGRARALPSAADSGAAPGSALESLERIAFGDVWQRPGLSSRERRLITLTCLGMHGTERTLELHLRGALDSGEITAEELDAFTLHFGVYAGFPRASAFASTLQRILDDPARSAPPAEETPPGRWPGLGARFDVERIRRVVTGLDGEGRSTIDRDGFSPNLRVAAPGVRYTELWTTPSAAPQPGEDVTDAGDVPLTLVPQPGGTLIRVCEMYPPEPGAESFAMHSTPTVDYILVLSGKLSCTLADGSRATLGPGEVVIQRSTDHAWSAEGEEPCVFLAVIVDADG
jgi:alkylhydroperoxidase/carboxymuconolactone decarboxylase family protein YurZ/quercetin dioxygenase-like cupin family protein